MPSWLKGNSPPQRGWCVASWDLRFVSDSWQSTNGAGNSSPWASTRIAKGNICLDLLAKMGANTVENEVTLEAPPESLGRTLLADAMRIAHLR